MEEKNPIQVAGRLFGALEFLAENGPTTLMELAQALDLNKSTVHRVLSSLQYMGYVKQEEESGRYIASFKLVEMASKIMDKVDVNRIVRPYLRKLSDLTGETVHFVEREGNEVVYIDKLESDQNTVRMVSRVGNRIPFYRSAVGKAMAANMSERQVRQLWDDSEIERLTPYTITDYREFQETLDEVRRRGYALDNEENETGVRCIGVALNIAGDQTKYAFSISAPLARMDNSRIRELSEFVLETEREIEKAMVGV